MLRIAARVTHDMETIPTAAILDRGAMYLGNQPDHLAKRVALAQVLVATRCVRSLEAGLLAFKIWAEPTAKNHSVTTILNLADEKATR